MIQKNRFNSKIQTKREKYNYHICCFHMNIIKKKNKQINLIKGVISCSSNKK